ncbi:hypothetical protein J7E38_05875 [Bacillus sp. ISL-35]|uniref:hypothetical protein n=1 Tax=Bacillus sp. ISL-35 TaxID=2819122 RepID=UPI001BE6145F|nr:hypothetical protein [Bacillus sp. ISL-35]MBT2678522.1 hypothetical protein [Bacillus sp. ISL-35]MBT2705827.1 hypothetical protein [Chryseobacterium sp. ISL-80]
MKRYWKIIIITAVIVLSLGTFYVSSTMSAESNPEFVIKTISGNAEEIQPLILQGSYTDTSLNSYVSTDLSITAKGSTYQSRSFLDQIIGQPPTVIKDFQEKYRTFMRGKEPFVTCFFEDEEFLAYANVDYKMDSLRSRDFKFDISVLNKEDGKIESFKVEVPDSGELEYTSVDDVQKVGDKLYLITRNMIRDNNYYEEEHIYTINLANQKVSEHEAIVHNTNGQSDTHTNVQLIDTIPTKSNEQLIFIKTELKEIEDAESTREEVINQEIISYNLTTKEQEIIDIPELRLEENQISFFDGSVIYFTKLNGQNLVVTPYSLADNHVGKAYSIELPGENSMGGQMTTIKDGKLYFASSQMSPNLKMDADVVVADVNTGKTLFRGQVALEDSSKESKKFDLYLHELFVK